MDARKLPGPTAALTSPVVLFTITLVALILDAGGGQSWGTASAHVVLAARFDHVAASPLYDLLGGAFTALVPAGEPGFRLGLLGALLGAATLAGVVAAAGALLPKDQSAGLVGALLLLIAPPFRDAAAFASPALLAAAGLTWALALALRFAPSTKRDDAAAKRGAADSSTTSDTGTAKRGAADSSTTQADAVGALAACVLVIGAAPWLGALVTLSILIWLARVGARRDLLALTAGAIGLAIIALWVTASGSLPDLAPSTGVGLLAAGRGAGALIIGAGLLGIGFGALTNLPRARPLALVLALVLAHEVLVGGHAASLLALAAIGASILPGAIVRAVNPSLTGLARHALTLGAGIPLLGVAVATGATLRVDDPGPTPRTLAHDLVDALPPGAGVFVATRPVSWLAVHHEMVVAGARPDLALAPPLPATQADAIVANALRADRVVGSDAASFGRLDVTRATPRGRGFQLLGEVPPAPATVLPPAVYTSAIGREQAILLALERARYEGANMRLDAAARAAGLEARFGAADLAVLGATIPTRDRPALFGLLPAELVLRSPGPWVLELFGDDLAWVAGITMPELPEEAPAARKLHAVWRKILLGTAAPDDPEIATLGASAVRATREIFIDETLPANTQPAP